MHSCIWTIMLPGRWNTCQKEVNHGDDIPTGKVHRFQKLPQPVLFLSVLNILCRNTYWLSPSCYGMWTTLPSQHKNSQAAECFGNAFVGPMLLNFPAGMSSSWFPSLRQVSRQPGSILAQVQLCVKFQDFATRASYLHPHCIIVLGVLCTFSDNLGLTRFHKHRGPIPWSMEGNHDLVLSFCNFDYSFSTTKFKLG